MFFALLHRVGRLIQAENLSACQDWKAILASSTEKASLKVKTQGSTLSSATYALTADLKGQTMGPPTYH
jgi:hypothetical protein